MKRNTKSVRSRNKHTYSEGQLAGLRASTATRKQETVERLRTAIASLKKKDQAITAQSIYDECGLHYASYVRNDEAIALFRANSTHLLEKKKRTRHKQKAGKETVSPPREPLLNYKKPQLASRLREAQQQIQDLQQQLVALADTCLQRDARVVELEAKLAELEPYRSFVEQIRLRVRKEEYQGKDPLE
jgi:triphosphoribosyl-dephospho-CoA synthetase